MHKAWKIKVRLIRGVKKPWKVTIWKITPQKYKTSFSKPIVEHEMVKKQSKT